MAAELCSENCGVLPPMSPSRISFSHDFSELDVIPVERHPLRSSSSSGSKTTSADFDFCVARESLIEQESSSADELFSDGRILPIEIKTKNENNDAPNPPSKQKGHRKPEFHPPTPTRKNNKESNDEKVENEKQGSNSNSKSFWSFKRSSSCGSGYGRSLCPLPLLSRSNSTGSSPKQNSQKHCSSSSYNTNGIRPSSSSSSHQKPPLKRSTHGNNNSNSVRVNPVLNVPPLTLFGFGSIFSNSSSSSRDKSKKK